MMLNLRIEGLKETQSYLKNVAKNIQAGSDDTIRQVGELGWEYAQNLVPKDRGFTSQALVNFPEGQESWIILSGPSLDHSSFPLNVYLDEGDLKSLNWGNRTEPKTGEFGFMKQTADFLDQEFSTRMNLVVERSIQ